MDIADLLGPGAIIASLKGSGKKQVLQELSRRAATLLRLNERAIFEVLWERERLGSTGMGTGTAIPHGKMTGIAKPVGLFARLEKPIDFEAVDERPVDLIFVLLTPEGAGADHLKALARVSRLFRDRAMCDKLRGTDNVDALTALQTDRAASHAA
jgi:PTS system nitrogen regulatory IIA component